MPGHLYDNAREPSPSLSTTLLLNDKTASLPKTETLTETMAAPQGFEPRYYGPEPHVLPLDEGAAKSNSRLDRCSDFLFNPLERGPRIQICPGRFACV